jgi:hypothetical protein
VKTDAAVVELWLFAIDAESAQQREQELWEFYDRQVTGA